LQKDEDEMKQKEADDLALTVLVMLAAILIGIFISVINMFYRCY
jgi:hypothetical protein